MVKNLYTCWKISENITALKHFSSKVSLQKCIYLNNYVCIKLTLIHSVLECLHVSVDCTLVLVTSVLWCFWVLIFSIVYKYCSCSDSKNWAEITGVYTIAATCAMHATYQQQVITTVTFVREVKVYTHRISTVVFLCQIIDPPPTS